VRPPVGGQLGGVALLRPRRPRCRVRAVFRTVERVVPPVGRGTVVDRWPGAPRRWPWGDPVLYGTGGLTSLAYRHGRRPLVGRPPGMGRAGRALGAACVARPTLAAVRPARLNANVSIPKGRRIVFIR